MASWFLKSVPSTEYGLSSTKSKMRGASYGHSAIGPELAGAGAPPGPAADRGREGLAAAGGRGPPLPVPVPDPEAPRNGVAG
eukprot:11076378-Alexandrium_andersonii.AAC.1